MDSPIDIEGQVEEFRAALDDFDNAIKVVDPATAEVRADGMVRIPEGHYTSPLLCDNCGCDVHLFIRHGFKVPRTLEGETCPICHVTGGIYRPITEKDMLDLHRSRRDNGPEPV